MFHAKYLLLRPTSKYMYGSKSIFGNAYYSDKKKIIAVLNPLKDDLKKVKECLPVTETFKRKTVDEIESITFQNEQDILRAVMTEKEKDASVRSRLSKECNELFRNRKVTLCTTGLLHFDTIELQKTKRDDPCAPRPPPTFKKDAPPPPPTPKGKPPTSSASGGTTTGSIKRITRGQPGKVFFAFIPEEWPKFFMPITGVSGFWTFLVTFGAFLVSKEYYILEHNYYGGLSMAIIIWGTLKYVGPGIATMLDREIDEYERSWQRGRKERIKSHEQDIDSENLLQIQADCQLLIIQAKRENVALQLEHAFRTRQMHVYERVQNRLEYHLMVHNVHRRIHHKNLVQYVTREVEKSLTPELQKKVVNVSIENILAELEKGTKK